MYNLYRILEEYLVDNGFPIDSELLDTACNTLSNLMTYDKLVKDNQIIHKYQLLEVDNIVVKENHNGDYFIQKFTGNAVNMICNEYITKYAQRYLATNPTNCITINTNNNFEGFEN